MTEAIAFDGPEAVRGFVWVQTMHKLALEINTGMSMHRVPLLTLMHRSGMIDAKVRGTKANKIMVLRAMVDAMPAGYTPSASITRALSA